MNSIFFFSSRRRHTRLTCDWSSDVCSSDLAQKLRRAVELRSVGEWKSRLDAIPVAEHRQAVADGKDLDQLAGIEQAHAQQRGKAAPVQRGLLHPRQVVAVIELGELGDRRGEPFAGELGLARIALDQNAR